VAAAAQLAGSPVVERFSWLPPSRLCLSRYSLRPVLAPPRLPPRIEHLTLRAACGLPAGLQRLLFGAPPHLDGQVLAPEMQALLRLAALAGDESVSDSGELGVQQARARIRSGTAASTGRKLPVDAVTELSLPGPAGELAARFYEPAGLGIERRPLVVYFHGGGWTIGDLDTHDGVCRFLAANAAATVLSVGYRLAPEHPFPAAAEDALAAFEWAAAEHARLGIDPARIAVAGDSAGGNLAAAVCLLAREAGGPSPAMQALIYPVTDAVGGQPSRDLFADGFLLTRDDMDWFERHYLPPGVDRGDPRVSPLRAADLSGLPPAYVATAGFDPLRDEGEAYAERMREAGARVVLRRHPGLIHGFANMTAVSRAAREAMLQLCGAVQMELAR
jgi:acetyl esterase